MLTNPRTMLYAGLGAGVILLGLYLVKKNGGGGLLVDAGAAAVGAAADVGAGIVVGIGEAVGIPRTNETECEKAMREGRTWDASFACPAGTFLSYLTGSSPKPASNSGALPTPDLTSQNPAGINFNYF